MSADEMARDMAREALGQIETHEAVCAERYQRIRDDMREMKDWLKWGIIAVIGALGTVAWAYFSKGH